jgi:hypothetical protein
VVNAGDECTFVGGTLNGPSSITVGPDGKSVYATTQSGTGAVVVFDRVGGANGGSGTGGGGVVLPLPKPAPLPKGSFAGTARVLRPDARGRITFSFRATPGLRGLAIFRSAKPVRSAVRTPDGATRKAVTFAKRAFTVPASGRVKLRVLLSRGDRNVLARGRALSVLVSVKLTNSDGRSTTATGTLQVKARKAKKAG